MKKSAKTSWRRRLFTVLAVSFFLVPAGVGFGNKFRELVILAWDEEGSFAVMPLLNYLLASVGFMFLLFWAAYHGMFHDIEKPKFAMLERERELDEAEKTEQFWNTD